MTHKFIQWRPKCGCLYCDSYKLLLTSFEMLLLSSVVVRCCITFCVVRSLSESLSVEYLLFGQYLRLSIVADSLTKFDKQKSIKERLFNIPPLINGNGDVSS